MIDLNPLNLPDAPWQHGLMLVVAGILGLFIGYASRQQTLRRLADELAGTEQALEECRRSPAPARPGATTIPTGSDEAAVLARIRVRAAELDFDRIGTATPADADNLKLIAGIGPFLERKLNTAGIYTYRQLANLTRDDVDQVNDIIEFFPGRIQRDNWVGQAAELERQKQ